MNLDNFESHVDERILKRGYSYYEDGLVISIKETDENAYMAKVEGTDVYSVETWLDDNKNIVDTVCDCPYDWGQYCKHQVAVFFALRDFSNGDNTVKYSKPKLDEIDMTLQHIKPVVHKTDIKKILSSRKKKELVDFLLEIASEHEEIEQRIELRFNNENDEYEVKKSIDLIRTYIDEYSDGWGYVGYRNTLDAVKGAEMVLDNAQNAAAQHKTLHAVELAVCVIREMTDLLQEADDSNGIIGDVIGEGFDLIDRVICNSELVQADKESVFYKLLEEARNPRYDGWIDWRFDFYRICSELADSPELRDILGNYLVSMTDLKEEDSWHESYLAEQANLIRYHVIERLDGKEKAKEFIEQNLQYSDFRKMAIENALEENDFDSVIKLAIDGEAVDKNMRGLIKQWKEYRYTAYKLAGKLDEQRELAVDFILDGNFGYYNELKKTYGTKDWASEYHGIISLLEEKKKTYQSVYTDILIEEGEKQKLFEHVKTNVSLIVKFYRQLVPEYRDDVYAMFRQYIEHAAARATNRKEYQGVCAIIRNLRKAGSKKQASETIQTLRDTYPRKPAFRDELSKV